jgi:hypothetical protein
MAAFLSFSVTPRCCFKRSLKQTLKPTGEKRALIQGEERIQTAQRMNIEDRLCACNRPREFDEQKGRNLKKEYNDGVH